MRQLHRSVLAFGAVLAALSLATTMAAAQLEPLLLPPGGRPGPKDGPAEHRRVKGRMS